MAYFITEDCRGCSLCLKSCPVHAITGIFKQRHVINSAACIDCGTCAVVCAASAIENQEGKRCSMLPVEQRLKPKIDGKKCCGCEICIENCVKDALTLTEPVFHGDTEIKATLANEKTCTGCGRCAQLCPQKAVSMVKRSES